MPSEEHEEDHAASKKDVHDLEHRSAQDKKKDHKLAIIGLAVAGVGVLITLMVSRGSSGGGTSTAATQPEAVNGSMPFVPNPTDVSYGTTSGDQSAMMLPMLTLIMAAEKQKQKSSTSKHKEHSPHKHKSYGHSPNGNSHGHHISPKSGSHPGTHHTNKGEGHHG